MRIFLTGGTGFIGQTLLRDYAEENEFTVITSRNEDLKRFEHKNINYIHFDYNMSNRPIEAVAKRLKPHLLEKDAVIHLGFSRPIAGKTESLEDYVPSLRFTEALLDAMVAAGIGNVVMASSRSVYSESLPVPHSEEERLEPQSLYGASKVLMESMGNIRSSICCKSLRFAQVLGWGEHQGAVRKFFESLACEKPLTVWGNGTESSHEYIYVRDAASALMTAASFPALSGSYNVGTGEMLNMRDIASFLIKKWPGESRLEFCTERAVKKHDYCLDCHKIFTEMNWRAAWSIYAALSEMISDFDRVY